MAKNLLIVESPAKAKTIEKILGPDFEVKSCFGHIRDLEKEGMGIDIENNFTPRYTIPKEKSAVVKELVKLAKNSEEVWLATDEDREGEAISWHLCEVLNLNPSTTKRIVFHEITKPAIKSAVENPRLLDMNLVNAQQARRILDRIVGFEVSPVLWRKMSLSHSLSAGRVQSVAVKLIVEREREINAFQSTSSFKTSAFFEVDDQFLTRKVRAFLQKQFTKEEEVKSFLNDCKNAKYTVGNVEVKPTKRTPSAPFTTSTLQQEASRKLGYSVSKTMLVAQRLYEGGHISYMRTDSVSLSQTALNDIESTVNNLYGKNYFQHRAFKNKNASAQEAHEAIRPTEMGKEIVPNADEQKLYDLIRKRTLASQMADALLEKTVVSIDINTRPEKYQAQGEVIKFDGFLKMYIESLDEEDQNDEGNNSILPPMNVGQDLPLLHVEAIQKYTRAAARYTEASLVKKLEELGIGRPSTYAPTISTIQKREYVIKGDKEGKPRSFKVFVLENENIKEIIDNEMAGKDRNKLMPTDIGILVSDFLDKNFQHVMNYGFTAEIENDFDKIAAGESDYQQMLKEFYKPFHESVEYTLENAERMKGERELGIDPQSGKPVFAKVGRYGPMIQIGVVSDEEKPRFAKLLRDQSVETILLEEAMKLFDLPRVVGELEGKEIKANIGRFGPYLLHNNSFYSLPKDFDPYTVDIANALTIIENKREADKNKFIKGFEEQDIQILIGRWGPYIKQGRDNYKLPKDKKDSAKDLTLEETLDIIKAQGGGTAKKTASKKSVGVKSISKKSTAKKATVKKAASKTAAVKKIAKKKSE